ncbi:MAG: asparagine synthase-related protein [Dermatophilaceae bacterium]
MQQPTLSDSGEPAIDAQTAAKAERVHSALRGPGKLAVAFSGGVDSAVLLALAVQALGPNRVVAVLAVSPSLATVERKAAHDTAAQIGARLVEVATREGERPAYRANGVERCYHWWRPGCRIMSR